jgi:NADH-quinone oxidoreductase subunit M
MGSWQMQIALYRIATILSCASIVVTAVYILRAVGQAIMGHCEIQADGSPLLWRGVGGEVDATWNENLAHNFTYRDCSDWHCAIRLNNLITPGTETIMTTCHKELLQ